MRFMRLSSLLAAGVSLAPLTASAQFSSPIVPCSGFDCSLCDLAELAQNLLNAGIFLAVFMTGILFAWAGFKYLTTVVVDQKSQATKLLTNAAFGLVIILAAWLIVDTIMKTLLGGDFGPWNAICSV